MLKTIPIMIGLGLLLGCGVASNQPELVASSAGGKADDPGGTPPLHWARGAVEQLEAAGITDGSAQSFQPAALLPRVLWIRLLSKAGLPMASAQGAAADNLTVAETVTLLCQALGWSAAPATQTLGALVVQGSRVDQHAAAGYLRTAVDQGVLVLEANPHNLEPDRLATRGEAAAMLYLALRGAGKLSGPLFGALTRHRLMAGQTLTPQLRWNREVNLGDSDGFFARWWVDRGKLDSFTGQAGRSIACGQVVHPNERAALIILPGYSESFLKYAELANDFHGLGFSVFGLDHRGQAGSGRFLPEWSKAHIDAFDHFVADLKTFIDQRVRKPGRKLFIYAHSQGAGIATLYMARNPGEINAAVLSSPMHQLKLPVWESVAHTIVRWSDPTGYAMGKGPYKRDTFAECKVTRSYARFRRARQLWDDQKELRLGGQTNHWVREAIEATWSMGDEAHTITTPLLLLQADDDQYVGSWRQEKICQRAQQCTLVKMASGSRHELYQEIDAVRIDALERAYQHYLAHP
jgi:lysophospholipase